MTTNVIPLRTAPDRASGPAGRRRLPTPAVYTVKEVAALLGLAVGTTYELVRQGVIPAERLGRRWVIPRGRFHAWLDARDHSDSELSATGTDHARRGW